MTLDEEAQQYRRLKAIGEVDAAHGRLRWYLVEEWACGHGGLTELFNLVGEPDAADIIELKAMCPWLKP